MIIIFNNCVYRLKSWCFAFLFNCGSFSFIKKRKMRIHIRFIHILSSLGDQFLMTLDAPLFQNVHAFKYPSNFTKSPKLFSGLMKALYPMYPKVAKDVLYLVLAAHRLNFRARILQGGGEKGEGRREKF